MNKKILLADDSVTIQRVVELTFSGQGYEVTCLPSGKDAVEAAREVRPDVVLLDVGLAGESGYDVCMRMKKEEDFTDVPVMLLTGTFEPFDNERARHAGASAHLTKPFESQVLVQRVSELIENPSRSLLAPLKVEQIRAEAQDAAAAPASEATTLSPEALEQIARRVAEQLGDKVLREVAWEVVPELAERLVRQRIRQIEEEAG